MIVGMSHTHMPWTFDDGGRRDEGYRGAHGDSVVRAVAIVGQRNYTEVFDEVEQFRRKCDLEMGALRYWLPRYMMVLGWSWTPTTFLGEGCTTHLCARELPRGRIVVRISMGVAAVVDRVLHDVVDHSRAGRRCVYGWWTRPEVGA